jgi:hypothetical protein
MSTSTLTTAQQEALALIDGEIVGQSVVYFDDSTRNWYVNPIEDLDYLVVCMTNPDTASDAYSHWCACTSSEEYYTQDEAHAAAEITRSAN